jgi:hypothetical protein
MPHPRRSISSKVKLLISGALPVAAGREVVASGPGLWTEGELVSQAVRARAQHPITIQDLMGNSGLIRDMVG